jgi:hypothetical protein
MYNKMPFNNAALDQKTHDLLAHHIVRFEDTPDCIRDVAVVGGVVTNGELLHSDVQRLADILHLLSQAGIPVHPNCRFWVYNLSMQSDFLSAAAPSPAERSVLHPEHIDLILCSYIYDGDPSPDPEPGMAVSQHHLKKNIWAQSALNLGARFIVTCGSRYEVNPEHFLSQNDFMQLARIIPPHNDGWDHFSYHFLAPAHGQDLKKLTILFPGALSEEVLAPL